MFLKLAPYRPANQTGSQTWMFPTRWMRRLPLVELLADELVGGASFCKDDAD
jgi:hypothetical protein